MINLCTHPSSARTFSICSAHEKEPTLPIVRRTLFSTMLFVAVTIHAATMFRPSATFKAGATLPDNTVLNGLDCHGDVLAQASLTGLRGH